MCCCTAMGATEGEPDSGAGDKTMGMTPASLLVPELMGPGCGPLSSSLLLATLSRSPPRGAPRP